VSAVDAGASRRTSRWGGPWTLRRRVLVAVLVLLALVASVIAVTAVVAVERVLTRQLDSQLQSAVERSRLAADRPLGDRGMRGGMGPRGRVPDFLEIPGQAQDTLGATITDGEVTRAAVLDRTGTAQELTGDQAAALVGVPTDGAPHTVVLGDGHGDYRVAAVTGAGGQTLVVGLSLEGVHETTQRLAVSIATIALLGLALTAAAGTLIIRRSLRPLDRVAATASRVAEVPLDRGEVELTDRVPAADTDPRTEVGQVGAALNLLLGHVDAALRSREASETRVRHFVADASHELRTPLAAIRGYAELTRRVPEPLPPDVAHALSRVESEATRMTALVEDLLLLARLDSGPVLDRAEVDLSAVVVDVVSDAHAAGPDHRWELQLPEEPVVITGDRGRLHQIVANLLANARTHTAPGTTVTATLGYAEESAARMVRLVVADDGPGVPEDLQPHLFERFRRGDASRSRAGGGTGLGLAIVAAVTEAHGGTVAVRSEPGHTEFRVDLPIG
jgi:two-component system, OmpR family, sensor kinase